MQQIVVIKQGGQRPSEAFEDEKLRLSIKSACLSVRVPAGEAELVADKVLAAVKKWLENGYGEITSDDLRLHAGRELAVFQPEAAYFYQYHHTIV